MGSLGLWAAALGALIGSALLSGLLAWSGPVDRPRERGMHTAPTPTCGGLAVMAATAACAALYYLQPWRRMDEVAETLGFAVIMGLIGAVDDVFDLGAKPKLALQLGLALLFWWWMGPPPGLPITFTQAVPLPGWLGFLGVTLWTIVVVNAVNFIDGANGLVAGAMAIAFLGVGLSVGPLGVGSPISPLELICTFALLGFLPWNFPKARLFQGDAGALFLGGLAAIAAPLGTGALGMDHETCLYALPISLLPILTDVLMTLLWRARRRRPLLEAHRDHLYQRWLAAHGGDHAALAWRFWAITAAFTAAGFLTSWQPDLAAVVLVAAIGTAVVGWLWIDRRVRRSG